MTKLIKHEPSRRICFLKKNTAPKRLFILPHILISSIFFLNSIKANLDLSQGRFVLFMDEQITFDGVREILHPESLFIFFYSIFDGGDQRYGRLLWNFSAIISFLPEKIFGESGQIVATRMLSTALLLIAAYLLANAFGNSLVTHFLIFTTIVSLPFTAYYVTMPKPEPLQLVVIGLIANLMIKKSDFVSRKLFLLLGLLLGIKISSLVILIPIVLWLAWKMPDDVRKKEYQISWRIGTFNLGLCLAVPTLLPTVVVITAFSFIFEYRFKFARFRLSALVAFMTCGGLAAVLVNEIISLAVNRNFLSNYLNYTVFGTTSGSDSDDVTALSWVNYFFTDWSPIPTGLLGTLLSVGGVLTFLSVKQHSPGTLSNPKTIFLTSALSSVGSIFVGVDRIWGFYLLIGISILASTSIGLIADWTRSKNCNIPTRVTVVLTVLILIAFDTLSFHRNINELKLSSNRTQGPDYKLQMQSFLEIRSTVQSYVETHPSKYRMALDPNYFQIEKLPGVSVDRFWGPFNGWGEYDFLVLKPSHLPPFSDLMIGTNEESAKALEVLKFYEVFAENQKACLRDWCYIPLKVLPDNGQILLKVKAN